MSLSADTDAMVKAISKQFARRLVQEAEMSDQERWIPVIPCENEPVHDNEHPFCDDWKCPCHFDQDYVFQYHTNPYRKGLLTWEEAGRLLYGQQI